jgi:hypothetical protein
MMMRFWQFATMSRITSLSGVISFMSRPQQSLNVEPSERVRSLRRKRVAQRRRAAYTARFRALGWELTGRLTVNLTLTLVGLAALVKLIPYSQTQRQVLAEVKTSIETLEVQNARLRADFTRYFDPAQTSQLLQENGSRDSERHIPVVWVDALPDQFKASPSDDTSSSESTDTDAAEELPIPDVEATPASEIE